MTSGKLIYIGFKIRSISVITNISRVYIFGPNHETSIVVLHFESAILKSAFIFIISNILVYIFWTDSLGLNCRPPYWIPHFEYRRTAFKVIIGDSKNLNLDLDRNSKG